MIAGTKVLDPRSHFFNDPRTFVTRAERNWPWVVPGEDMEIAVAQPARYVANEDLSRLRRIEVDVDNLVSSRN